MSNDVSGLKLRTLMSRPFSSNGCTFSTTPTHFFNIHNPKLAPWTNQPLRDYGEKREMSRGAPLVSSRWNPTPEQVQALEEMYRRGTRTPTAEQIQQIVGKLRRFGKIEGKNVFYWFQNHKARDRQKKRRQLELLAAKDLPRNQIRKQSGFRMKYLETEQHPKKLPTMSRCSTVSQYPIGDVEECKRDRWTQLGLQQQSATAANSTMQLDLSSCMSPNVSMHKLTNDQKAPDQENAYPFTTLSKLATPKNDDFGKLACGIGENRTLELFPVRSNGLSLSNLVCSANEDMNDVSSAVTKSVRPNQFFEFLPIKD